MTSSPDDRDPLCIEDMKIVPGDHSHNGRDRDLLDRHLDSLSMSSASSACSALSWDSSPSLSCTALILKKEPSDYLEEDEEHEVILFGLTQPMDFLNPALFYVYKINKNKVTVKKILN